MQQKTDLNTAMSVTCRRTRQSERKDGHSSRRGVGRPTGPCGSSAQRVGARTGSSSSSTVSHAQVNCGEQEQPGMKEGVLCEPMLGKFWDNPNLSVVTSRLTSARTGG